MDELTMLVQLAGGDQKTVHRLRAAGFRGVNDLARADADDLCAGGDLSAAASRRLVRAAKEMLAPRRERGTLRNGLRGVPSALAGYARSGKKQRGVKQGASVPKPGPRADAEATAADQGVGKAESSALLGETPRGEKISRSFWRFG